LSASQIHHVGVAVANLDESIEIYRRALGAELVHRATSDSEGIDVALLRVGSDEIELMSPLRDDSPVGKFMTKRGPGLHHVAYGVPDIDAALAEARGAGLELVDAQPRIGLNGRRIAFVHPKSMSGVLTELVET
jgi:methylmalonyl-CoA epimerase